MGCGRQTEGKPHEAELEDCQTAMEFSFPLSLITFFGVPRLKKSTLGRPMDLPLRRRCTETSGLEGDRRLRTKGNSASI